MLPLELALPTDADLARQQRQAVAAHQEGPLVGPPMYLATYLAAEQSLGRVRGDVDPAQVAVVVLATLFGLALVPSGDGNGVDRDLLASAVRLLTTGIAPTRRDGDRTTPDSPSEPGRSENLTGSGFTDAEETEDPSCVRKPPPSAH